MFNRRHTKDFGHESPLYCDRKSKNSNTNQNSDITCLRKCVIKIKITLICPYLQFRNLL
ncbi:hypothetical protein C0J52_16679 [Blattella germanica]|nr:hypothetical protein C0J52_16679 [Blattella germanica]